MKSPGLAAIGLYFRVCRGNLKDWVKTPGFPPGTCGNDGLEIGHFLGCNFGRLSSGSCAGFDNSLEEEW